MSDELWDLLAGVLGFVLRESLKPLVARLAGRAVEEAAKGVRHLWSFWRRE